MRVHVVLSCAAALVTAIAAPPAAARARQTFATALVELTRTLDGVRGDEGPQASALLDQMARALAEWDRDLQQLERQVADSVETARPADASRMLTTLGVARLQRGHRREALEAFDRASVADPRDGTPHLLRGLAHRTERPADAVAAFRRAWELDQQDPVKAYWLVQAAHHTGAPEPAGAIEALAVAYRHLPEREAAARARPFTHDALLHDDAVEVPIFALVRYHQAYALLESREYDRALAALREAAARDPLVTDPALRADASARGIAELKQGRLAAAVALLEKAAAAMPDSSELQRALGMAYRGAGQFDNSVARLEAAIALDPMNERARLELVSVLEVAGTGERTRAALHAALEVLPASGALRWMSAVLHRRLNDEEEMLRQLEAIPPSAVLAGRGQILAAIGRLHLAGMRHHAAVHPFYQAVLANPNNPSAHLDLGELYRTEHAPGPALAAFVAALLMTPDDVLAHTGVGQVQLAAGRHEEAVLAFRRAVSLAENHPDAQYGLATALLRIGRPDDAAPHMEAFRRLAAERHAALRANYELFGLKREAAIHADEGRHAEAIAAWREVLTREPAEPGNYRELGEALIASGDVELGIAMLERSAAVRATVEIHRRLSELYAAQGREIAAARARAEYERLETEALRRRANQ